LSIHNTRRKHRSIICDEPVKRSTDEVATLTYHYLLYIPVTIHFLSLTFLAATINIYLPYAIKLSAAMKKADLQIIPEENIRLCHNLQNHEKSFLLTITWSNSNQLVYVITEALPCAAGTVRCALPVPRCSWCVG